MFEELDYESYDKLLYAYENNEKVLIRCKDRRIVRGEVSDVSPYDVYIQELGKSRLTILMAPDIDYVV
ncbi:hypothetical protein [Cysteiniphilum litorale]|uniref:hypothetical protein n=1 Tax=Cysteiniphilum litorale TaxID=2056700 RepID=UPI003F882799